MKTKTSSTCVVYPIVAALDKADDMLGKGRVWKAVNNEQKTFLSIFQSARDQARSLPNIKSICSINAAEINDFLAKEGFQINLSPFKEPTDFGLASVLDILVEWLENGQPTKIFSGRDGVSTFPGVILKNGVRFATSPTHTWPIAIIETKSGDRVCMTIHEQLDSFALLERAEHLRKNMRGIFDFKAVHFPQVDLDQMVDISWLKKLRTSGVDGYDYEVVEAFQQTKFRMNEKGARAESAVAMGVIRITSIRSPMTSLLVINKPFLVWIERNGFEYPLFIGWISEKSWKTPKDISKK